MSLFVTVLHVTVCLVLIVVVLLQRGKGAEIGAVFGGGASNTVFGSRGAGNFFTRLTTGAAVVFMITSLTLSYLASQESGLFDEVEPGAGVEETAPAEPFVEIPTEGGAAVPAAPGDGPDAGGFVEIDPAPAAPPAETPQAP